MDNLLSIIVNDPVLLYPIMAMFFYFFLLEAVRKTKKVISG